ncbi:hypothetical protein BD324DRAFT_631241 [Kockovaella imperatae]|uniref:Uncharacterized protein n=1 Tax=Kockovaella imperatae TaxID=4999 RepID=A0A1Y1UF42_9TREE|nr:hypothetical protein BD324DRAFT_631241 [Kockovaella imperatae]ORX35695.1 hypothetical protein BD324DRAFT_631241 [Kockovaella imperatae]
MMTKTPSHFAPDPAKWINTSSSSKPKVPLQRPLIGFKQHGIPTPTPSRLTDSTLSLGSGSKSRPRVSNSTPNGRSKTRTAVRGRDAQHDQSSLGKYMTPDKISSKPSAKQTALDKIRREVEEELTASPTVQGADRALKLAPFPMTVKKDDFWGSDDDPKPNEPVAGPSRSTKSRTPEVIDLTFGSQETDAHCPHKDDRHLRKVSPLNDKPLVSHPPTQAVIAPIPSSNLHSPEILQNQYSRTNRFGSPAPAIMSSGQKTRSSLLDRSPPNPITPIPPSILAIHQHLCGRDDLKAQKKAQVKDDLPKSQRAKRDVDLRVQQQARTKVLNENAKPLVHLSSDGLEEKSSPAHVLSPLRTNTMRSRHRRGSSVVEAKHNSSRALAKFRSARVHSSRGPGQRDLQQSIASKESENNQDGFSELVDFLGDHPQPDRDCNPLPSSPVPIASRTPLKQDTARHHQITPPKTRSSSKRKRMEEHTETLFAFPPPPQPKFTKIKHGVEDPEGGKKWNAVDMDPETLLTWSLGGSERQSLAQKSLRRRARATTVLADDSVSEHEERGSALSQGADPCNSARKLSSAEASPNERVGLRSSISDLASVSCSPFKGKHETSLTHIYQIGPSEPSQSFPVLVQSSLSPDQERPPYLGERIELHSDITPKTTVTSTSRWNHLKKGILSVPAEGGNTPTSRGETGASSKKTRVRPASDASQSKLAAFGFFKDVKTKTHSEDRVFDRTWDEERDLEFEEGSSASSPRVQATNEALSLRPVPEAPHHPNLRAAGIRELVKRQSTSRQDVPSSPLDGPSNLEPKDLSSSPPLFPLLSSRPCTPSTGPDTTSATPTTSSSLGEEGGQLPTSIGKWWAQIGDREIG